MTSLERKADVVSYLSPAHKISTAVMDIALLPAPVARIVADFVSAGQVLLLGGIPEGSKGPRTYILEHFDPLDDFWARTPLSLPVADDFAACWLQHEGLVVVSDGITSIHDPHSLAVRSRRRMPFVRHTASGSGAAVALVHRDRVFACGNINGRRLLLYTFRPADAGPWSCVGAFVRPTPDSVIGGVVLNRRETEDRITEVLVLYDLEGFSTPVDVATLKTVSEDWAAPPEPRGQIVQCIADPESGDVYALSAPSSLLVLRNLSSQWESLERPPFRLTDMQKQQQGLACAWVPGAEGGLLVCGGKPSPDEVAPSYMFDREQRRWRKTSTAPAFQRVGSARCVFLPPGAT